MPSSLKRTCMLEEVLEYHLQQKQARTLLLVSELLDDLPSSDDKSDTGSSASSSSSSPSSIFSPSSVSTDSGSQSFGHHSSHDYNDFKDLDCLEDEMFQSWDARTKVLTIQLLSAHVLEACPPVKKVGQLDLYLTDVRNNHPGRFQKKLHISPHMFNHLMELIRDHKIFHNNSNVPPQLPIFTQLTIFLVHVGHYGNASAPEYVAQWARVSVEMVINATYQCLVAFLNLHDEVVMMPPEEEKEHAKEFVEKATCPEWRNGFLLANGTKFPLFQKPGLHGEAWFDKNKNYSIDCQV